ncbi:MAG: hypothetical protein ACXAC2_16045 [Candidatus Kariarchaeaceae archaeon]|jgi:hypothetical protein
MPHCLSKTELDQLIKLKIHLIGEDDIETELYQWLIVSGDYTDKIIVLNYIFSMLLETFNCDLLELKRRINLLYNLPDQMWLEIQEFDYSFVTFMSRYTSEDWGLEDILIKIQTELTAYKYD